MAPDFKYEKELWEKGYKVVVGADEVGRGAWTGPIAAGAVVFAPTPQISNFKFPISNGIRVDDSKKLSPRQREKADKWIRANALSWGIGSASVSEINRCGMAKASRMAFRRAIVDCNLRLGVRRPKLDLKNRRLKMKNISNIQHQNPASMIYCPSSKIDFLLIDAFYLPCTTGLPVGRKKRVTGLHPVNGRQLAVMNGDEKSISIAAASIIAKVYRDKLIQKLAYQYQQYGWGRNKGYGTKEHQEAIKKHGPTHLHRKQFISKLLAKEKEG